MPRSQITELSDSAAVFFLDVLGGAQNIAQPPIWSNVRRDRKYGYFRVLHSLPCWTYAFKAVSVSPGVLATSLLLTLVVSMLFFFAVRVWVTQT